jgi:hypothetical protein
MSESAGAISIDVGVGKETVTSFLAKLETQLERSNTTLERFASELERRATGSQERAAQGALTHAQALARLQSNSGNTAAAIRTMEQAIRKLEPGSLAAIRAETQLVQLRAKLAKETAPAVASTNAFGASLLQLAGPLGIATSGTAAFLAIAGRVKEGFDLRATLDEQRRGIGTLVGDVQKGNQIFQQAADFGRKYGFTQKEMGTSAAAAAPLIRTSTTAVEKQLEVLGRLASLNTQEGFQGAVFSTKELASGDITSIVERFNLARSAANQMKAEIASGKDVFAVLDAQLSKMGVTVDVLNNRTQGAAGAMRTYAQAQEDLTLAMGQFAEGPGQKILGFLTKVTSGVTQALTASEQADAAVRKAFAGAETFDDYQKRITFVGEQLAQIGIKVQPLSEAQFRYAQSLVATGVAADQAHQKALDFNTGLIEIGAVQAKLGADSSVTAQQIDVLSQAMVRVGSSGAEGAALLQGLTQQILAGSITTEQANAALTAFEAAQQAAASAAQIAAINVDAERQAVAAQADANQQAAQAILAQASATDTSAQASLIDAANKERQAAEHQLLVAQTDAATDAFLALNPTIDAAGVAALVAAGKIDPLIGQLAAARIQADDARAALARFNLEAGLAQGAAPRTNRALSDGPNIAGGGLGGGAGTGSKAKFAVIDYKSELDKERKAYADSLKTHKAAGGARASAQDQLQNRLLDSQDKFHDKVADAEREHADRILEIQADFAEKMRDAQDSFDQARLDGRASFYTNLGSIENQGIAQAASQQYEAAAQEAAQIAQEKGADVAEKYMAAQEKIIGDRAKRLADIEKAENDKDKGRAEYLRGLDQLDRNAEDAKLARIKEGKDSIAAQQQQQLADEEAKYADSRDKIALADDRASERLITNAQRRGAAIDAELLKANQLATTYDRIAPGATATATAAAAPPAPPPTEPTTTNQPATPLDGAAILGKLDELRAAVVAATDRGASKVADAVRSAGRNGGSAG